ncbi:RNA polymerase sigma factor [Micromonospora chersina]|uniref:Sigma-70, region 4 n=1 Tax=Micromonospora chersina TaxID=47854 RepID=A0A1C6W187_9ACTN|nr:sigma factor-like helix-turn-helix DNA-binding protein [Micromonospora chersina]SCL71930.1 Sigma-70, region 4 [Micromonospora chersina]
MSGAEWASAQLVAAARDGHVESLTALVANTRPHVLRFAHTRVLVLRDVQGYPGRAVADSLGLSLAAMKSQLHRARTNVKAALRH